MSEKEEEIKSSEIAKVLNIPLKKTVQALQRLHFQKYIVYSAYQPLQITEKGKQMALYLASKDLVLEEFLNIIQLPDHCQEEKEAMHQYLSYEALECIERFVIFVKQYPEIMNRYRLFNKRKLKMRMLEQKPEDD